MNDKLTPKMIRKAAKKLSKGWEVESQDIEVEVPKLKTDFLRVIDKRELVKYKLVTDKNGDTKEIRVKPTLLL